MNIPNSPEELLRQHQAQKQNNKECQCNICKVMRTVNDLEMSMAEVILVQNIMSGRLLEQLFFASMEAVENKETPSALALSHLAGQIAIIQSALTTCMKTIKEMHAHSGGDFPS
jgi:hypothetical protein